jgi:hypothetical protein
MLHGGGGGEREIHRDTERRTGNDLRVLELEKALPPTEGKGFEDYPGFGWDGTAGNQPRGTSILRNFAHELGIFNKQSAMYFQAATDNTTLEGRCIQP